MSGGYQIKDIPVENTNPAKTDSLPIQEQAGGAGSLGFIEHQNLMKINNLDSYGAISGSEAVLTEDGKTTTATAIAALAGSPTVTTKDDDYTILDDDGLTIIALSGAGAAKTFTLPTLSANQNRQIKFINLDTTYNLTIDGEGAETIGALTDLVLLKNHSLTIVGTSGTWAILELTGSSIEDVQGTDQQKFTKFFTGTTDGTSPDTIAHGISDFDKILNITTIMYGTDISKYRSSELYYGSAATAAFRESIAATNITLEYGSFYNNQNYRIKIEYYL